MYITFEMSKTVTEYVDNPQKLFTSLDEAVVRWGNYNPYRAGEPLQSKKAQACIQEMTEYRDAITILAIQKMFGQVPSFVCMSYLGSSPEKYLELKVASKKVKVKPSQLHKEFQFERMMIDYKGFPEKSLEDVVRQGKAPYTPRRGSRRK